MASSNKIIFECKNLSKHFTIGRGISFTLKKRGVIKAVDGINLRLKEKEILGIAGESGSGKSTTAEMIVRLLEPSDGEIFIDGKKIDQLQKRDLKDFVSKVQMIFQDPFGTLNPRNSLYRTVEEPLIIQGVKDRKKRLEKVINTLELAELKPAEKYLNRLPFQLSGGESQRVAIARAMVLDPRLLIADEPVSMLDVSIRAGILNLLKNLRDEAGISIIYISHDLSTIRYLCDRIAIMYLGKIVEMGITKDVINHPKHPYTELLVNSVPAIRSENKRQNENYGEIPDQIRPHTGCNFSPRCRKKMAKCESVEPEKKEIEKDRFVSCHLY